tara:strand:- start:378 stop:485 length:108 start_codon:yes stop_codon:yes gene_type:complete
VVVVAVAQQAHNQPLTVVVVAVLRARTRLQQQLVV